MPAWRRDAGVALPWGSKCKESALLGEAACSSSHVLCSGGSRVGAAELVPAHVGACKTERAPES